MILPPRPQDSLETLLRGVAQRRRLAMLALWSERAWPAMMPLLGVAGLGAALLPRFLVETELDSGVLVPLYPHPVVSPSAYYLVAPRAKSQKRPIAQFRSWLLVQVAENMEGASVSTGQGAKGSVE